MKRKLIYRLMFSLQLLISAWIVFVHWKEGFHRFYDPKTLHFRSLVIFHLLSVVTLLTALFFTNEKKEKIFTIELIGFSAWFLVVVNSLLLWLRITFEGGSGSLFG